MNHGLIIMTVHTYGCHIATTTRGVRRDPGALRNSLRKISLLLCPFLVDSRRMFGLVYSPWEQGCNKSPWVPGLSFPSSYQYRDSTFLSIFQPHLHADSLHVLLKVDWYGSKGPNNNRHCNYFSHGSDFCNFIFQWLVFPELLKFKLLSSSSSLLLLLLLLF